MNSGKRRVRVVSMTSFTVVIGCAVFATEFLIHLLIPENFGENVWIRTVAESAALVGVTVPLVYLLIFRPLKKRTEKLRESEEQFRYLLKHAPEPVEALSRTEERLRLPVETSPQLIAIFPDGLFDHVIPAGLWLIGAEQPGQIIGTPELSTVHPDDRAQIIERINAVDSGNTPAAIEERLVRMDGSTFEAGVTALATTFNDKLAGPTNTGTIDVLAARHFAMVEQN
ncbi:MAG TPA: hypothetical protein VMM37_05650 [Bacteroidota bacterium]|nr:hypothetical protein [Bacteroidota bacterium]